MRIYFIAREKLLASAGIEIGSPLEAILQSERSTTEQAGRGKKRRKKDTLLVIYSHQAERSKSWRQFRHPRAVFLTTRRFQLERLPTLQASTGEHQFDGPQSDSL